MNREEKILAAGVSAFLLMGEIGSSVVVDSYAVVYAAAGVGFASFIPLLRLMYKQITC